MRNFVIAKLVEPEAKRKINMRLQVSIKQQDRNFKKFLCANLIHLISL